MKKEKLREHGIEVPKEAAHALTARVLEEKEMMSKDESHEHAFFAEPGAFNESWREFYPQEVAYYLGEVTEEENYVDDTSNEYAHVVNAFGQQRLLETVLPIATISTPFGSPSAHSIPSTTPSTSEQALSVQDPAAGLAKIDKKSTPRFIFDTGASIDLTDDPSLLHDYVKLPTEKQIIISGAFGTKGKAIGVGKLIGKFQLPNGKTSTVTFPTVFHAPNLGHNLLSGYSIFSLGYGLHHFDKITILLTAPLSNQTVIKLRTDSQSRSLVVDAQWVRPPSLSPPIPAKSSVSPLSSNTSTQPRADVLTISSPDANDWHKRCGHIGDERLRIMAKGEVATGFEVKGPLVSSPCESCAMGKFVRRPVPQKAESRAKEKNERLHSDVYGPTPTKDKKAGEVYILGVIDDYSRFISVEGMVQRSEVPQKTATIVRAMETVGGKPVKRFRHDGAKEYLGLKNFFDSKGVVREVTLPYEHQQNGVIERVWKTLLNMARSSLFQAGLPASFLILAIKASAHVYNRIPHSANDDVSPYERYHDKVPDVSDFKPFGCIAYVWSSETRRTKEESRTRRCAFVGYAPDSAGSLFYDLNTLKFFYASPRQALWFEHRFPKLGNDKLLEKEQELLANWKPYADEDQEVVDADQGGAVEEDVQGGVAEEAAEEEEEIPNPDDLLQDQVLPPPPDDGYEYVQVKTGKNPGKLENIDSSNILAGKRSRRQQARTSILSEAQLDLALSLDDSSVHVIATLDPESQFAEVAVANSTSLDTPTIRQALNGDDRSKWISAIMVELEAMKERKVYDEEPVDLPPGGKAIPLKWVLLIKRDESNEIIKYKARLVARGDLQRPGIDFDQVYSNTVRFASILIIFAKAAVKGWSIKQFDVSTAFLHATLPDDLELFIRQPPGFADSTYPDRVLRLRKSLYGLRQAGREWSKTFIGHLRAIGFEQSEVDNSLFVRWREGKVAIVPVHVDDGLVVGNDDLGEVIDTLNERLEGSVKEEPLSLFLGIKIRRLDDGTISLDQSHYVDKLSERFNFTATSKPTRTPFDPKSDLRPRDPATEDACGEPYRELLGGLIWLSTHTRPDIAYAVSVVARFSNDPAPRHWTMLKRILRYLHSTKSYGLAYSPGGSQEVEGWTDADHAADPVTRRSISGWAFTLGGCVIDWQSKRQPTVTTSSTEAEYVASSSAGREAIWIRNLLVSIGTPPKSSTIINVDNRSAMILANHPTHHERTKHIDVHAHFIRDRIESGEIKLKWTSTENLAADVLTKGLGSFKHYKFLEMLGLRDVHLEGVC